jgi:hypothetical protein
MVMPLLYGLGARDFLEPLGFVLATCQKCHTSGPFAVYQAKRKITLYAIPTVSFREQVVIECRSCTQRFAVPAEMRTDFLGALLDEAAVAARIRQAGPGGNGSAASGPTFYQTLQVDVAADPEVIEAAFRRLAMKYHPDRSADPAAPEKMRRLLEAKECPLRSRQAARLRPLARDRAPPAGDAARRRLIQRGHAPIPRHRRR